MHFSLTISLDPLADSFVDALSTQSDERWPCSQRPDAIFFRIASREWMGEAASDTQTCLDTLGEIVLDRLARRSVSSVDIDFLLYGNDRRAAEMFLPVYRHFQTFLKVGTTRRLYVIYPRKARLLAEFGNNLTEIQEDAASATYELAEVGFLVEPETPTRWPRDQVLANAMSTVMAGCRVKLDEVLTSAARRCCNSTYSACVYDIDAWRTYHVLRSTRDLAVRHPISRNTALTAQAERFLETRRVIADESRVRYAAAEIGSLTAAESIAHAAVDRRVETYLAESGSRQKRLCTQIESFEHMRLQDLGDCYRKELVEVFDRDRSSLDSFEQALCLHHTILELLDPPSQHRDFFLHVVEPSLERIADHLIAFADSFSRDVVAERGGASRMGLDEKLALLPDLLGDCPWSEISLCLRPAALGLLSCLRSVFQISSCVVREEKPRDPETAAAISEPFGDLLQDHLGSDPAGVDLNVVAQNLDQVLEQLKGDYLATQRDLKQMMSEYGFFGRVFRYRVYKSRRAPILRDLNTIEQRYQEWRTVASACCNLAGQFLFLQNHVRLVQRLFAQRKQKIEATGQFLVDFATALAARNEEVTDALDAIVDEPQVRDEVELLFLAKPQMEALYQRFGPVQVHAYIEDLLRDTDNSWGVWASTNLRTYLSNLPDYCAKCFRETPKLDLPTLMFEHFPEERIARVKRVVELAVARLIPLTADHLHDRTFHMLFGFPQLHLEQLANDESQYAVADRKVSLNPTRVDYLDNADPNALDLAMSVCGFRVEDYLYWGVFNGSRE